MSRTIGWRRSIPTRRRSTMLVQPIGAAGRRRESHRVGRRLGGWRPCPRARAEAAGRGPACTEVAGAALSQDHPGHHRARQAAHSPAAWIGQRTCTVASPGRTSIEISDKGDAGTIASGTKSGSTGNAAAGAPFLPLPSSSSAGWHSSHSPRPPPQSIPPGYQARRLVAFLQSPIVSPRDFELRTAQQLGKSELPAA